MRLVLLTIFLCCIKMVSAQLVTCPQGKFDMGSEHGSDDERPVHVVELSAFMMSKNEITQTQYDSCVQSGKCTPAHYDDGKCVLWNGSRFIRVKVPIKYRNSLYPVVCVSWHQAKAYCRSKGMNLPTEAQWEYAARANVNGTYSWGNSVPSESNCTMAGAGHPSEVGAYPSNQFGLNDMTGNAWEWTADYYGRDEYSQSVLKNPVGPDAGLYRVIRGGGWYSGAEQLRITNRYWFSPEYAEASLGFRCVKSNNE